MNERVSFVCARASQLRKGNDMTQHEAFIQANKDWKQQ